MRFPNFLIVGAPKAGTTSMHHYLSEHPEIYLPAKKELHYFSYDYLSCNTNGPGDVRSLERCCADFNVYKKHFEDVSPRAIAIGEASPSYLFFTDCISRIKETLGKNVKILIMVRNPIARAFSMYSHLVNTKRESLGFFDALQAEEERLRLRWGDAFLYKAHSLYYKKIEAYMDAFGVDNVKVVIQDYLKKNTVGTMQEIYSFLGADPTFVPENINVIYGRTGIYENRFATFLAKPNRIKASLNMVIPFGIVRRFRYVKDRYLQGQSMKTSLPDDRSVAFLKQYFMNDISRLENQLCVDLSSWK